MSQIDRLRLKPGALPAAADGPAAKQPLLYRLLSVQWTRVILIKVGRCACPPHVASLSLTSLELRALQKGDYHVAPAYVPPQPTAPNVEAAGAVTDGTAAEADGGDESSGSTVMAAGDL